MIPATLTAPFGHEVLLADGTSSVAIMNLLVVLHIGAAAGRPADRRRFGIGFIQQRHRRHQGHHDHRRDPDRWLLRANALRRDLAELGAVDPGGE